MRDDDQFQWWLQQCDGRMTSDESVRHAACCSFDLRALFWSISLVHSLVRSFTRSRVYLVVYVGYIRDHFHHYNYEWLVEFDCLCVISMNSNMNIEYSSAFALTSYANMASRVAEIWLQFRYAKDVVLDDENTQFQEEFPKSPILIPQISCDDVCFLFDLHVATHFHLFCIQWSNLNRPFD